MANIKDVLIGTAIRTTLFLQRIAVEIKNIYVVEGAHEALAHSGKGGVFQVAVIGDHAYDTLPSLLNLPLGKTKKLYVIVLQPFRIFLAEGLAIHLLVILNQPPYPVTLVARMAE